MFTGIVSEIGTVIGVTERNDVRRIAIACSYAPDSIAIGSSIARAGICMTVIAREDPGAGKAANEFEARPETLTTTSIRELDIVAPLNLVRSLKIGDQVCCPMVGGHIY